MPFYDPPGELVAMVGFSTDVTMERRREAERQRDQLELAYLARASSILDSSLELPVTLQQLAELAVPFIGDGCMVDVRREDGTIERYALAAVDDELRDGFVRLHRHPSIRRASIRSRGRCAPDRRSCRRRSSTRNARHGRAPRSTSRTCGAFPADSGWSLR